MQLLKDDRAAQVQELTHALDTAHAELQRKTEYQKVLGDSVKEFHEAKFQRTVQLTKKIWEAEDLKSQTALLKQQILALREDVQQKTAKLALVKSSNTLRKGPRKMPNGRRIAEKRRRAKRKLERSNGNPNPNSNLTLT
jgi:hypothetical protein